MHGAGSGGAGAGGGGYNGKKDPLEVRKKIQRSNFCKKKCQLEQTTLMNHESPYEPKNPD